MRVMKDWLERCLLFPELVGFPIEWHAVQPGVAVTHGPFTLTAFATEHLTSLANQFRAAYPATSFDCYGVAIDCHGRRYVYSADLAHPRELAPALEQREVTALICELSHFPERELFRDLAKYDVKSLWLTHYPDTYVGQEKELQITAREEKFAGAVHLLQDKVANEI
jgi:ribonuclease BN (tRNA processing enzyme)